MYQNIYKKKFISFFWGFDDRLEMLEDPFVDQILHKRRGVAW